MAKRRVFDLEEYSEDAQEILGHVPRWIANWCVGIYFMILAALVTGSYIIKYQEVVSTPIILTSSNPPITLTSKNCEKVRKWYITNGQYVKANTILALLDTKANYKDIRALNSFLNNLDGNWLNANAIYNLTKFTSLGSIQYSFDEFYSAYSDLHYYLKQDSLNEKVKITENRILNHRNRHELLVEQRNLQLLKLSLLSDTMALDSITLIIQKNSSLTSKYRCSLQKYINQKSKILSYEDALRSSEENLFQFQERLFNLKFKQTNDLRRLQISIDEALKELRLSIDRWTEEFLLISPIEGKIFMNNNLSQHQSLDSCSNVATIVPYDDSETIAEAFIPESSLDKVRIGQKVNIKLSSFSHIKYGVLFGHISNISSVHDKEGYTATVNLSNESEFPISEKLKSIRRIDGTANIMTDEIRFLHRLIRPIRDIIP